MQAVFLNEKQQEAVQTTEGPVVIYAGAGSGKTRVIVERIAHLIEKGCAPASIMAVTFTNKAAKEMKERVAARLQSSVRSLLISTFHSCCARFLRLFAQEIGYSQNFTIVDDGDQKTILKAILKGLNLSDTAANLYLYKGQIEKAKNKGLSPEQLEALYLSSSDGMTQEALAQQAQYGENFDPHLVCQVYRKYQAQLRSADSMDFNDLLVEMVHLLETNQRVKEILQNRYRYFMVDEFQDTNPIQFRLMELLSEQTQNLCIVGDDDQSIYSWRGADPSFILNFSRFYKQAVTIKLEENYRSRARILRAANAVVSNNVARAEKSLWTQREEGDLIECHEKTDAFNESLEIVTQIYKGVKSQNRDFSDYAILYRTNAQSRALEDGLRRRMIPYIIHGSVRFYERAEIKTLMSYFKLLINPRDDMAFSKVINTPKRGLGTKALERLDLTRIEVGKRENHPPQSLLQTALRLVYGEIEDTLGRGTSGLRRFIDLYTRVRTHLKEGPGLVHLIETLLGELDYETYIRASHPEDFDQRWENVTELKNALAEFDPNTQDQEIEGLVESTTKLSNEEALAKFVEQALLTIEPSRKGVEEGSNDAVTLMTIHSSKGLEFPHVFVAGLEQGILPHFNSLDSKESIEEERRLFYVAMTRAKDSLILSHIGRNRFRPNMPAMPSQFLKELPPDDVKMISNGLRGGVGSSNWSGKHKDKLDPLRSPYSIKRRQNLGQFLQSADELENSTKQTKSQDFGLTSLETLTAETSPAANSSASGQPGATSWEQGDFVQHKIFGKGKVVGTVPTHSGFKLEVDFPRVGKKRIMDSFVEKL